MAGKAEGVKTNAMRVLDKRKVAYEARGYDSSITSAAGVASAFGVSADEVYKTLVMLRDGFNPILVMVPGDREVNLKTLAASIASKSVQLAPMSMAEELTGLKTGGIGALALLGKTFDIFIDADAMTHTSIFVNSDQRGLSIRLAVADLIDITGAVPVQTLPALTFGA